MSRRAQMTLMFVLVTLSALTQFGHVIDDPLITLRHAHNVLSGYGPVFNPGDRVEGFTSPLHLVIAIVVEALPGGAKLFELKLVSVVFTYLAAHRAVIVFRRVSMPTWAQVLATVMVGTSWAFVYNVGDALETTLSVWLVTWLLDLFISEEALAVPWKTGTIAAVAYLTRPENALIIAVFTMVALLREQEITWWPRVRWAIVPAATAVVLTGARLAYYGELFPNTYYAKSVSYSTAAGEGVEYLWHVFMRNVGGHWQIPGLTILAAVATVIALAGALMPGPDRAWLVARRYAAALVGAQVVFVLLSGGTGAFRPRFVMVMAVPVVLLVVMGVTAICRRLPVPETAVGVALIGVIGVAGVAGLLRYRDTVAVLDHGISDRALVAHGGMGLSPMWAAMSDMAACAPASSTIATSEIGLIGTERPDLRIVDMRGLANATLAHDAPREVRKVSGINDPHWYRPGSAVGQEILRSQPVLILTFDRPPADGSILDGRYRLHEERKFHDTFVMRSFARVGGPCDPTGRGVPGR